MTAIATAVGVMRGSRGWMEGEFIGFVWVGRGAGSVAVCRHFWKGIWASIGSWAMLKVETQPIGGADSVEIVDSLINNF
jgi:hypothetical protein